MPLSSRKSRRRRPAMLLLAALCLIMQVLPAHAAGLGQAAPAFELPGDAATAISLAAERGKVVYLDFWASWCGPCRQSFPWMNEMQAKYGGRGLQILAVNLDAREADAKRFLAETPANFRLAYDSKGTTPRLYGVKGMPTSYLIDREGRLVYEHAGFNLSRKEELERAIVKWLDAR